MFNYLLDLVVYSASISDHLREVLGRLRSAGFMMSKFVLCASEIKYLRHCHPEEIEGSRIG